MTKIKLLDDIVTAANSMNVTTTPHNPLEITDLAMYNRVCKELRYYKHAVTYFKGANSCINSAVMLGEPYGDLPNIQECIETTETIIEGLDIALSRYDEYQETGIYPPAP